MQIKSLAAMRQYCRERGIRRISKMTRFELLQHIAFLERKRDVMATLRIKPPTVPTPPQHPQQTGDRSPAESAPDSDLDLSWM